MKKSLLILFLFPLFVYQSQSQDFSIVGTWKQVSFKVISNGITVSRVTNSGNGEQLKSWSKERFLFAGKVTEDNKVSYSFGNGNYSLLKYFLSKMTGVMTKKIAGLKNS